MTIDAPPQSSLFACFASKTDLADAARRLKAAELGTIEAYRPHPVEALESLLPDRPSIVPLLALAGGVVGFFSGLAPDIGGPSLAAWPSFIPAAFGNGLLSALLAGFFGFLFVARHPGRARRIEEPLRNAYVLVVDTATPDAHVKARDALHPAPTGPESA